MEGMYMFPPRRERKRNNIFTAWNQCVSTRNKHLYNIYMYFWFFFSFHILSCNKEGWFVLKGFHCNKKYLTCLPVRRGRNETSATKKIKWKKKKKKKEKLWTAIALWKNRDTAHEYHPSCCSGSQTWRNWSLCDFLPPTHLHCKQNENRIIVLINYLRRDALKRANNCLKKGQKKTSTKHLKGPDLIRTNVPFKNHHKD